MRDIDECREFLGGCPELTDDQVGKIRDDLMGLAIGLVRIFESSNSAAGDHCDVEGIQGRLNKLPCEVQGATEERAAIMEFDGGLDRDHAERAALAGHLQRQKGTVR